MTYQADQPHSPRNSTRTLIAAAALALLMLAATLVPAAAAETRVIEQYRVAQARAQKLSQELLRGLLDDHVQQLEENGLTDIPLYQDLVGMRSRVGELADAVMPEVIEKLTAAQMTEDPKRRSQLMSEAQVGMKQVLRRLLAERERLRMRRKQAELVRSIREIIEKQTATRKSTTQLSAEDFDAQIAVKSEQETVRTLFDASIKMLEQVSSWPGDVGATAAEARRLIKNERVAKRLDGAQRSLVMARFEEAQKHQQDVVNILQKVLLEVRKLDGDELAASEPAQLVEEIVEQQEEVRDRIKKGDLDDKQRSELIDKEAAIREKIRKLGGLVPSDQRISDLLHRADEAARETRQNVFNEQDRDAAEESGKVIGSMMQLASELEKRRDEMEGNLTAAAYEKMAEDLGKTREKLEKALEKQQVANAKAESDHKTASKAEQEARRIIDDAARSEGLPRAVESRMRTASEEAGEAAQELARKTDDRTEAVQEADKALRHAIGEAAEAEQEAKRKALAVKLGELNRASEALSRAAAVARDTADKLEAGEATDAAEKTKQDVKKLGEIAKNVSEGVEGTADKTTEDLEDATEAAEKIAAELPEADAEGEAASGEAEEATEAAKKSAEDLDALAKKLDEAADEIRNEMADTADKLAEQIEGELDDVKGLQGELAEARAADPQPGSKQLGKMADDVLTKTPSVGAALKNASEAAEAAEAAKQAAQSEGGEGEAAEAARQEQIADAERSAEEAEREASREMDRAGVMADIKRDELERELALAKRMAELARRAADSATDIADARDALEAELKKMEAGAAEAGEADTGEPMAGEPSAGEPAPGEPSAGEAAAGEPTTGEPTAGEPSAGEAAAGEPSAGEPSAGEAAAGEPSAGEPSAGEAAAGEPSAGEPSAGEPTAGEPSAGQPSAGEPSAGEPTAGAPSAAKPTEAAKQAAGELGKAMGEHAAAIEGTGDAVQQFTEQKKIANVPIKKAIEIADSLLPQESEAGDAAAGLPAAGAPAGGEPMADEPAAGQPAAGQPAAGEPSAGQPSAGAPSEGAAAAGAPSEGAASEGAPSTGAPGEGSPAAGAPSEGAPSAGAPSTGAPSAGAPAPGAPAPMGEGMVPASPGSTAQMMGGAPAAAAMAMGQAMGQAQGQGMAPGMGMGMGMMPGQPSPMPSAASAAASGAGTSMGKMGTSENMDIQEGDAEYADAQGDGADSRMPGEREGDADADRVASKEPAWFNSLPESVRGSMKSRGDAKMPAGYEDRLKQYFENTD